MGFLDPSKLQEDDELPGGSGLHLDLETRACPSCQREALPWQTECEDCGVPTVLRRDVAVPEFELPNLLLDDEENVPGAEDVDDTDQDGGHDRDHASDPDGYPDRE